MAQIKTQTCKSTHLFWRYVAMLQYSKKWLILSHPGRRFSRYFHFVQLAVPLTLANKSDVANALVSKHTIIMILQALLLYLLNCCLQAAQGRPQIVHWNEVGNRHPFVQHTSANGPKHSKDKCEIEIFTRGSCIVNNNQVKPQVILNFEHKQYTPDNGSPLPSSNQPVNRQGKLKVPSYWLNWCFYFLQKRCKPEQVAHCQ